MPDFARVEEKVSLREEPCIDLGGDGCEVYNSNLNKKDTIFYGNCAVEITWDEHLCFTNPGDDYIQKMIIENFIASPIAGQCDSILDHWENLAQSGMDSELADAIDEFMYHTSLLLEDVRVEFFFFGAEWSLNGDNFKCENSQTFFLVEFVRNFCYQIYYSYEEEPNYLTVNCGSTCCRRETQFCTEEENGELVTIKGESIYTTTGQCSSNFNLVGVRKPYEKVGNCEHECR